MVVVASVQAVPAGQARGPGAGGVQAMPLAPAAGGGLDGGELEDLAGVGDPLDGRRRLRVLVRDPRPPPLQPRAHPSPPPAAGVVSSSWWEGHLLSLKPLEWPA